MLFLVAGDKIQIATGSATANVNMYSAYADVDNAGNVTINRNAVSVSTATTTDLVPAPATNHTVNVKRLNISNDSSSSNTITVYFYNGTSTFIIDVVVLGPSERLGYEEGTGFRYFDAAGKEKVNTVALSANTNMNTADITPTAATDTYLSGSSLAIAGRIQVGSVIKWKIFCSKTAASTAAAVFTVRFGTAGAIGDTARNTLTLSAQTAVLDSGEFDIVGTFTAIGSSAVFRASLALMHGASAAGLVSTGSNAYSYNLAAVASSAFDVTPAGTIIGLSLNTGTSAAWTLTLCQVEAFNMLN